MKKLLILTAVIVPAQIHAQNPFAEYGYEPKIATYSQGQFNEFFDQDTIVQIGSVLFNTNTNEIVAFVEVDTIYSESTLQPDIVSRWMSPDPLAAKYAAMSPYNFLANSPILFIDPDGKDFIIPYETDRATTKAALALAFNGQSDAFSFDQSGKLSIDRSLLGGLSKDQQFLLDKFEKNIVTNPNVVMKVELDRDKITVSVPQRSGDFLQVNTNINVDDPKTEIGLHDTEDGRVRKEGNQELSDLEKAAVIMFHDIGHVSEDVDGNKMQTRRNDRRTVGFENVFRNILQLNERLGKYHGIQDQNDNIKENHKGCESPTDYNDYK